MNRKKELVKNTLIISIGKFSTKIVQFLLLPLYTSILTTSQYGEYDLLNIISIFLIPIITLQMDEGMFRFLIEAKTDKDKSDVFSHTIIFTVISSILWSLIIFVVGSLLNYQYTTWLIAYCLASVVYSITSGFSRGEGNFKLYSVLAFLNSLFNILLNILFLAVFKLGLPGLFLAYIISSICVGLFGLFRLHAHKYLSFKVKNRKLLKEMIKYSFPLVPNNVSWSIISLSDRLLIVHYIDKDANGIYAAGNKFPTIINTCFGFFNTSWRESASRAVEDEEARDKFYKEIYITLKHFLVGISISLIALLPFIFSILVNKAYNEAYLYIPIMIISIYYANMSSFSSGIFSAYKDNNILAPTTIVAAIINVVFDILLINKIGLWAPVIGTFMAYFIINTYRNYKLRKYVVLPRDPYTGLNIVVILAISCSYYLGKVSIFNMPNWLAITLQVLALILGVGYSYYINKSFLKAIFNKKIFSRFTRKLGGNKNG